MLTFFLVLCLCLSNGEQVVAECGKLPLALKVIGASLRDQNEMFWLSVKSNLSRGHSIGESYEINLIDRMAISTDYLPEKIKECFLDLCSFPEDRKIPLEILINMWVEIHDIREAEAYAIVVELSNKNLLTLVKEARYANCKLRNAFQHVQCLHFFSFISHQKHYSNTLLVILIFQCRGHV